MPFTRPGMPCARRPSSFPYYLLQRAWYLWLTMRWQHYMTSLVSSLKTEARTSFRYWWRARVQLLVVCRPISKLAKISSQVISRKAVFPLVLLDGVASSSASTSGGAAASACLIYWQCMSREATRGDQCGSAALGMSGAVA